MRSSTTVLCRALVMLSCLIAVPLVALFGTSLPQVAKEMLGGRFAQDSVVAREALDEAPEFTQPDANSGLAAISPPSDSFRADPRAVNPESFPRPAAGTLAGGPIPTPSPSPQPGAAPGQPGGMVSVGYNAAIGSQRPASSASWPNGPSGNVSGGPPVNGGAGAAPARPMALVPVTPIQAIPAPAGGPPMASSASLSPPSSVSDGFSAVQQRLRGLGATYYRLESWGNQQPLFRFQCEMALDTSPHLTQHFEVTDADPLQAMRKVLAEVEAWKARQ